MEIVHKCIEGGSFAWTARFGVAGVPELSARPRWANINRSNLLYPAGALEVASRAHVGTAWALETASEPEPAWLRYKTRIGHSRPLGPAGRVPKKT